MRKIKPLPKKNQIQILEAALENFDEWYFNNGTCALLARAYGLVLRTLPNYGVTYGGIPAFNITRARRLAIKHGFKAPLTIFSPTWWWDNKDSENRKLFLKYLIEDLKSK